MINAGHRECKTIRGHKEIALHDGLTKHAAKLHFYAPDSSRSLKPRIPPESQIMSMLRPDVGAVRGSDRFGEKAILFRQLCLRQTQNDA